MNYFYGPVPSRRLGFSLGVNLFPEKTCSFDCVYCQLGTGGTKRGRRRSYLDAREFARQLTEIVSRRPRIDYITISGSGEPTLYKNLGNIVTLIKKITAQRYPVCVITNSFLLHKKEVRNALADVDLIIPSLDAACERTFCKINRPLPGITLKTIIKGLVALRHEFKGKIWLEIMVVAGYNDTRQEAEGFKEIIKKIDPDEVHLNLPVRPSGTTIRLPTYKKLFLLKKIIGRKAKIVSSFYKEAQNNFSRSIKADIVRFVNVRPATAEDLTKALGINKKELLKYLQESLSRNVIQAVLHRGRRYFVGNQKKKQ